MHIGAAANVPESLTSSCTRAVNVDSTGMRRVPQGSDSSGPLLFGGEGRCAIGEGSVKSTIDLATSTEQVSPGSWSSRWGSPSCVAAISLGGCPGRGEAPPTPSSSNSKDMALGTGRRRGGASAGAWPAAAAGAMAAANAARAEVPL